MLLWCSQSPSFRSFAFGTLVTAALLVNFVGFAQNCGWGEYPCGSDCCPIDDDTIGCYALDPSVVFGVNPHWTSDAVLLEKAREMNMRWAHLDINWYQVEATEGTYDWRATDKMVAALNNKGFRILGLLWGTPSWASANGKKNGPPKDANAVSRWRAFVREAVKRYRSIEYWEPWNEPNNRSFWSGTVSDYYAKVLEPAAKEIHSQGRYVVAPTLTNSVGSSVADFFSQLGALDASSVIDVISQNYYGPTSWPAIYNNWQALFSIYNRNGFSTQPVWVTETGVGSSPSGEYNQAMYLLRMLYIREYFPRITNTFIYHLWDHDGKTKGVLDSNGNPKAAYYELRDVSSRDANAATTPGACENLPTKTKA